jgi:metallo-beta-lactamase class B
MVYADSLSAPGFRLLGNPRQPDAVGEFRRSFAAIAALPCEVLLTPHPDAAALFERVAARDAGKADALIDRDACRDYAQGARERFEKQLATEREKANTIPTQPSPTAVPDAVLPPPSRESP